MSHNLISVQELITARQHRDVVVIDCRFSLADADEGERLYANGHIPGAFYLHLNNDLSSAVAKHGGRHPLPDARALTAKLESLGVSNDTLVVAYDDNRLAFASRLWWLLRYLGHKDVKVLNGGYGAWCQALQPVSCDRPAATEQGRISSRTRPEMVVDIEAVKSIAQGDGTVLVDSREKERYLGIREPIDPVAGHIDGAVNHPWQEVTDESGFFLNEQQQRQRWGKDADASRLVIYCGSGVTACVNLLSLSELGRDDAKLYAGSWSDWASYL